jgi:ribosomal protein L40E
MDVFVIVVVTIVALVGVFYFIKNRNNPKTCKNCGNQIPGGAKACPRCGKKLANIPLRVAALVIGLSIALWQGFGASKKANGVSTQQLEVPRLTLEEYKANAKQLNYRNALLGEGYVNGDPVFIIGRIAQSVSENRTLLVATDKDDFLGYIDDRVYIRFDESQKVLEGDIVRIYGRYMGTKKYKTVLQIEAEVPYIEGYYCIVIQEAK